GGHRPIVGWHGGSWKFRGSDRYPPEQLRPEVMFRPFGEGDEVGVVSKHVQGFVRTNSGRFPFAGTHSHKDVGSVFFVETRRGGNELASLYRSGHDHPSGMALLGDHVFLAEKGRLRWLRVSDAGRTQDRYELDQIGTAGGGLGLARLPGGATLLLVTGPGGGFRKGTTDSQRDDNLRRRVTTMYRLAPNVLQRPSSPVRPFAYWEHEGRADHPDRPLAYSENMSVVTECGSGKIYT